MCVELSDECDLPSEKEVDADTSSIRLLRTSRSQEAGKEVIKGEKSPVIKREQDNSKRKSRESNNGKVHNRFSLSPKISCDIKQFYR